MMPSSRVVDACQADFNWETGPVHLTRSFVCSCLRAIAIAGIVLTPSASGAQVLEPGARVRVTEVDGLRQTAAFESIDADSIRLATSGGSVAVPVSRLAALEISTGRHRRFGQNLTLVTGALAMAGGLVAAATYEPCEYCMVTPDSRGEAFLWGAMVGGAVGLPIGLVAGAAIQHERWAPLYHPAVKPLRVSVRPVLGRRVGFAAAVAIE